MGESWMSNIIPFWSVVVQVSCSHNKNWKAHSTAELVISRLRTVLYMPPCLPTHTAYLGCLTNMMFQYSVCEITYQTRLAFIWCYFSLLIIISGDSGIWAWFSNPQSSTLSPLQDYHAKPEFSLLLLWGYYQEARFMWKVYMWPSLM